jgi:hypothetical protein
MISRRLGEIPALQKRADEDKAGSQCRHWVKGSAAYFLAFAPLLVALWAPGLILQFPQRAGEAKILRVLFKFPQPPVPKVSSPDTTDC